uniref:C2H2-type domain-containing protein n=1 Tax=Romanomermis culicivorax TaxID=13658 RepID=A0A915IFR7_ROMCU
MKPIKRKYNLPANTSISRSPDLSPIPPPYSPISDVVEHDYIRVDEDDSDYEFEDEESLSNTQYVGNLSTVDPQVELDCRTWMKIDHFSATEKIMFNCCFGYCNSTFASYGQLEEHLCFEHFLDTDVNQEIFTCGVRGCGLKLKNVAAYKRHLIFHCYHAKLQYKGAIIVCSEPEPPNLACRKNREKSKFNALDYNGESLECSWHFCNNKFDDVGLFLGHVADHCREDYREGDRSVTLLMCLWEGCSSVFQRRHELTNHVKSHTKEKSVACPCCGAFFSNDTKFADHIMRQTKNGLDDNELKCFHCNKVFPSERLLREHSRRHINTHKCPYCEMTANGPHNMRLHIRSRHSDVKGHQCTKCSSSFTRKNDLQRHIMSIHSNEKVFECDECGSKFPWKQSLLTHKRFHAKPTYACHLCSNRYSLGNLLSRHLRKEHGLNLPAGHKRFIYKRCADGLQRLQTIRYENSNIGTLPDDVVDPDVTFDER